MWDGKERRNMSQDSIERDRLLTEVSTNVKFLVDSQKNMTQALVDHAKVDDHRFGNIDETLKKIGIRDARFYGVIYGGSFVLGGIGSFLMKVLFK